MDIIKNQNNARLSKLEQERVRKVIKMITPSESEDLETFKEAFMLLINHIEKQEVNKPVSNDTVIDITPKALENLKEFRTNKDSNPESPLSIDTMKDFIYELYPVEPEKVEVEVEVEKEKELQENQFILTLDQDQKDIADEIIKNRNEAHQENGSDPETIEEVFKNCFFNEATLYNYGGGFFTGLND